MKNTIRASRNDKPATKSPQGKKPSIPGQKTASVGQITTMMGNVETKLKGKIDYATLCFGLELGLTDAEIEALSILKEFECRSINEYLKIAVTGMMKASAANFVICARDAHDAAGIAAAQKALSLLKLHLPVSESPAEKSRADRMDGLNMLIDAVRESEALNALMLNTIENRNADAFREDNCRLAAGVHTLMQHVNHDLEMAYDAVHKAKN